MGNVVLTGVDTLEVGFCVNCYDLFETEWFALAEQKEMARSLEFDNDGGRFVFRGQVFSVKPGATKRHRYILQNGDIELQVNPDPNGGVAFPELRVKFSSAYLWRYGWKEAYYRVRRWLDTWVSISEEKLSRVDLAADVVMPIPRLDRSYRDVVTQALSKSDYYVSHHTNGLRESGYKFGSGDVVCRMYDKPGEIERKSGKEWFFPMWKANGWKPGDPVTRTEFQLRRDFLRHRRCDTVADLITNIAGLWDYLSTKWLSVRYIGQDSNRSRWRVKPFWKSVQKAGSRFGDVVGISRVRQARPKLAALRSQARGLIVSMAALVGATMGGESPVALGKQYVLQHFAEFIDDVAFDPDVKRRGAKLAAMV